MKKLRLIIPLSILILFLCLSSSYADTPIYGCRFGSRIWANEDLTNSHPNYPAYFNYSNTSDNGYNNFSGKCYDGGSSPCYIYTTDGTLWHQGTLGSISYDNCPFDNYIPLLLIFTIGFTILRFKKQYAIHQ